MRESDSRKVQVAQDDDEDPIGAAVFLTADELAHLGVDPNCINIVRVTVENGSIQLESEKSGGRIHE